jgi:hypothetical protein
VFGALDKLANTSKHGLGKFYGFGRCMFLSGDGHHTVWLNDAHDHGMGCWIKIAEACLVLAIEYVLITLLSWIGYDRK